MSIKTKLDESDKEILALLVQGKTAKHIGKIVFLSHRTVEKRITILREYYNAINTKHLIAVISKEIDVQINDRIPAKQKAESLIQLFGEAAEKVADVVHKENQAQVQFWNEVKQFIKDADNGHH